MSEIGLKMIEGALLSREEWQEACDKNILTVGKKTTYEGFVATHYSDGKRQGYICAEHAHRADSDNGDGYVCGWGFHLEDLDPRHITDINAMFIAYRFGREELNKLFSKSKKKGGRK